MIPDQTIRLATWNLRFDSMPDSITVSETLASLPGPLEGPKSFSNVAGEQPWSTRRVKVAQQLISKGVIIAVFQEALKRQVDDMLELLQINGQPWDYVGVGRDDGITVGEFSPIFFNTSQVQLVQFDTFWLSPTPFVPGSKFPGAGSVRICTASHLNVTTPGSSETIGFVLLNTHLDDQSEDQRQLGASLILARARYEAVKQGGPVIVTGDFNSTADGADDSGAYRIITGVKSPVPISPDFASRYAVPDGSEPDFHMVDIRGSTKALNVSGNFATFTDFIAPENSSSLTDRIDFVFGGSNGGWSSESYEVPSALSDDGILASDHRATFATLISS
ncbi:mannose-6-phosphatase [Phellopilus nigrolimitatus]|nr:mannose-6-phosphatase [Phellopilus nigrolimitatus]